MSIGIKVLSTASSIPGGFSDGVVYTAVDFKGFFIDAVEACNPPDSVIVNHVWIYPGPVLCAVMLNQRTGTKKFYTWNFSTRRPEPINDDDVKFVEPRRQALPTDVTGGGGIAGSRRSHKPRKPGTSMERAKKAWHERYE